MEGHASPHARLERDDDLLEGLVRGLALDDRKRAGEREACRKHRGEILHEGDVLLDLDARAEREAAECREREPPARFVYRGHHLPRLLRVLIHRKSVLRLDDARLFRAVLSSEGRLESHSDKSYHARKVRGRFIRGMNRPDIYATSAGAASAFWTRSRRLNSRPTIWIDRGSRLIFSANRAHLAAVLLLFSRRRASFAASPVERSAFFARRAARSFTAECRFSASASRVSHAARRAVRSSDDICFSRFFCGFSVFVFTNDLLCRAL